MYDLSSHIAQTRGLPQLENTDMWMFFREIISVFGDVGGGEENLTGHMNTCWKNPLKQKFNYLGCELNLDGEPDFDKKKKK